MTEGATVEASPSAVRVRLLCHAATSAARQSAFATDEQLDAQGARSLVALAFRVSPADRCWTSPALRARQTAQGLGVEATVDPLLRDCDYGRWAGRSFDDVRIQEPEAVSQWLRDPASAPHGGESIVNIIERAGDWLEAQNRKPGRTIAITHSAVIRAAIVYAIGASPQSFWRIDVAPLSLTRLSGANGRWTLASIGRLEGRRGADASEARES